MGRVSIQDYEDRLIPAGASQDVEDIYGEEAKAFRTVTC
jgi:hypothetical protein